MRIKNLQLHKVLILPGIALAVLVAAYLVKNNDVSAATGAPNIISYQGRLTDSSGSLVGGSGTTYYFTFSIWTTSATRTGSRLWPSAAPSTTPITVADGVFNVNIGDTANGYPDALNYNFNDNDTVYLQVQVSSNGSSFETLSPRQ